MAGPYSISTEWLDDLTCERNAAAGSFTSQRKAVAMARRMARAANPELVNRLYVDDRDGTAVATFQVRRA